MEFKMERCKCGYSRRESNPKTAGLCPRCGEQMKYSENWYTSYQVNGKRRVESVGPNKKDAVDRRAKVRVDVRENRFFDKAKDCTWRKAKDQFLAWAENNLAPLSVASYRNSLKNLTRIFDGMMLSQIRPANVERYKKDRLGEGAAPGTVNLEVATLKRLVSLAATEEWGLVEIDRIHKVPMLKTSSRVRFLEEEELARLLAELDGWNRMAVMIAVNTGLRSGAIKSMPWKAVDFQAGTITVKTKGSKIVTVPMTAQLRDELVKWRAEQLAGPVISPYVFPPARAKSGSAHVSAKSMGGFHSALKRAGIEDFVFHDLRHTFATLFYRRTKDWKALQEILGHADISTTMKIYTHLHKDHLQDAMKEFGGVGV